MKKLLLVTAALLVALAMADKSPAPITAPASSHDVLPPAPVKCVLSVATDQCSQHVVMVLWHNMQCGHGNVSSAALSFAQEYFAKHQIFNQMTVYGHVMGGVIDELFAGGESDPLGLICKQEGDYIWTLLR